MNVIVSVDGARGVRSDVGRMVTVSVIKGNDEAFGNDSHCIYASIFLTFNKI